MNARFSSKLLSTFLVASLVPAAILSACSDDGDNDDAVGGAGGIGEANGGQDGCDSDLDLNEYDYDFNLLRSAQPPQGLSPSEVPQFVVVGWDDNGFINGFSWATDMLAARDLKNTFYFTTTYISDGATSGSPVGLRNMWRSAYLTGHEVGNHTQNHLDGTPFSSGEWEAQLTTAQYWLTASPDAEVDPGIGVPEEEIYGFRSPFLNYNDALFEELRKLGIWYDCSIEEGFQLDIDASQMPWPYTLDEGSQGHDYLQELGVPERDFDLTAHPGIIELPAYALVIPPDEVAEEYDIEPGLLSRTRALSPAVEPGSDRITGLDYNLWADAQMSGAEFLAVLKYNLDQRLSGNRAPFLFGAHTDFYRDNWPNAAASFEERRKAIEDFLDYARSLADVRVTTAKEVVDFLRVPRALNCD